jgi:hypothetical protein
VNLSPKGLESFRVIDPQTVTYLDLTGSGIETVGAPPRERSTCERRNRLFAATRCGKIPARPETGSISA